MARHRDDGTGRCVVTELFVTMCAGCRGHTNTAVDLLLKEGGHGDGPAWTRPEHDAAKPAPDAHAITARFHGHCTAVPGCEIWPGDAIIPTRAGTWMHDPNCPGGKR